MKHTSRISLLLAALILVTGTASAGCSLSDISALADQFREEYAPPQSDGDSGLVEAPPPPIVKPGDEKPETDVPEAETDAPELVGKPEEEDPGQNAEEDPAAQSGSGQASSRPLTLKNAASVNEMSLLVARYGCVLTEEATANGLRKGYHYLIDTPGGRASVEFCDMRGTPSGCFGTVRTADGVTLYASAADYDNPAVPVSLSESAGEFTAFENPFAPYLNGSMKIVEQKAQPPEAEGAEDAATPAEGGDSPEQPAQTEDSRGILVRCENGDGTRRADFTLDPRSYEILSFKTYDEAGAVARDVTYTLGADRFGADRMTAALTDYYSLSPEELTFTLEDVRKANALSALLPVWESAGYVCKTEENGRTKTEEVVAYSSGGRQIVVYTDTVAGSPSERRYLRDGIRYPDRNGYAYRSAETSFSTENLISSHIPDGTVGSVTVSGSSVLFTVRSMQDGIPVVARVIVEKDTLLLKSCEVDTTGADAHALSSLTVTRGGAKTDEAIFTSLGEERIVTYHIEWENAAAEDAVYPIPAGWAFRLSFLSGVEYWYDAAHTEPAPLSYQAAADGEDREIWVTGARKVRTADVSEISAARLVSANAVSSMVSQYGAVSMIGGDGTVSFKKDGGAWIRYVKDGSGESAEIGAVRMKAEEDGWTSYVASYGDVVKNPNADYAHDDAFASLFESALKSGILKELVPLNGGAGTGDRMFYVPLGEERFTRFTVDGNTMALRSWQTVNEGNVEDEIGFYYGIFAGDEFLAPWERPRTAAFHVLNEGAEVAFIRVIIPQSASFRLEMPDGWDWFFLDKALTDEVSGWIQVPAGEDDAELWVDNREPASRPAQIPEPSAPQEEKAEGPAREPDSDSEPDWEWDRNEDPFPEPDGEGASSGGLFRNGRWN